MFGIMSDENSGMHLLTGMQSYCETCLSSHCRKCSLEAEIRSNNHGLSIGYALQMRNHSSCEKSGFGDEFRCPSHIDDIMGERAFDTRYVREWLFM